MGQDDDEQSCQSSNRSDFLDSKAHSKYLDF